jgi:hypothetical protein
MGYRQRELRDPVCPPPNRLGVRGSSQRLLQLLCLQTFFFMILGGWALFPFSLNGQSVILEIVSSRS